MVSFLVPIKISEFGYLEMRFHAFMILIKDSVCTFLGANFVQKGHFS